MSTLDTILVVANPAMQVSPALRRGVELARRSGASLHVCLFDHDMLIERTADLVHPDVMQLARRQFLDERLKWLSQLSSAWAEQGLKVECEAVWAPAPHEALLAKALEVGAGMIVKDVQRESLLQRLLFTPADWKAMRYAPAPLMLVGPESARLPRRMVAAVDTAAAAGEGGPNEAVVRSALELARYAEAELHLAHVFPYMPLYSAPYRKLEDVYAQIKQQDAASFADFARAHSVPEDRRHLVEGEPAPTLARLVRHLDADLIVLGSVHRSAVQRLFLGGTAESILGQVSCDVLLVKPADALEQLARHVDVDELRRRYRASPEGAGRAAAATRGG
ncbi:MAG: universal stress protein [Gammaproteobacteria bacterium]|nr:universal stress protein [Gammaproteobacteria bacterium]